MNATPLRRIALTAAIGLLIVACSTPGSAPTGDPATPSAPPSVAPSVAPSANPSPSPSTPAVSPRPSVAPPSVKPSPSPTPAPVFSAAEQRLVEALRADVRVSCAPRRTDLPQDAVAGVECHPTTALVDRVGIYSFKEEIASDAALQAYLVRLVDNGVNPRTGDCLKGVAGDSSWPSYLPDEDEDLGYRLERSGCFLDENGTANVRLTCYDSLYVGILGKSADLAGLYQWSWRVAAGEDTHRDPPGICAAPD